MWRIFRRSATLMMTTKLQRDRWRLQSSIFEGDERLTTLDDQNGKRDPATTHLLVQSRLSNWRHVILKGLTPSTTLAIRMDYWWAQQNASSSWWYWRHSAFIRSRIYQSTKANDQNNSATINHSRDWLQIWKNRNVRLDSNPRDEIMAFGNPFHLTRRQAMTVIFVANRGNRAAYSTSTSILINSFPYRIESLSNSLSANCDDYLASIVFWIDSFVADS